MFSKHVKGKAMRKDGRRSFHVDPKRSDPPPIRRLQDAVSPLLDVFRSH